MAEAEQFSLRWNNFHSNLSEGFHSLLEEVDLVDVTLAAEGRYLQAHKLVLSVCSPYFKQLFKVNPCKHPIVILKDVCYKDLEALLQFMYQGEVNVCQEELAPFLKTAEMLQIKGLTGNDSNLKVPESPSQERSFCSPPSTSRPPQSVRPEGTSPSDAPCPFKRLRTESPVSSTPSASLPVPREVPSEVKFVPLTSPKREPMVDLEADGDSIKDSPADLVQLLHGSEASQPSVDLPPAPVLFNPVAGLPQDSGGSQDSMQGRSLSERKIMQVGHHELHLTALRGRNNSRLRRRCALCYDMNRKFLGNHAANLRTAKVSTYCATCDNGPFMCVTCFKIHVSSAFTNV